MSIITTNGQKIGSQPDPNSPTGKAQNQLNVFTRNFDSAPSPTQAEMEICIAEARKLLTPIDGETEIPELDYITYAHVIFREKFANYKTNMMQFKFNQYLESFNPKPKA